MGLEVGWHLRFARASTIEVLLNPKTLGQVADHAGWVGGWSLASEEKDDHILVRLTREP